MIALLLCLACLIGWVIGAGMGSRERERIRAALKGARQDATAWKNPSDYWSSKAGLQIPRTRIIRQKPLTERLAMKDDAEAKAAREAWGDQVQAEELIMEIDDTWENLRG